MIAEVPDLGEIGEGGRQCFPTVESRQISFCVITNDAVLLRALLPLLARRRFFKRRLKPFDAAGRFLAKRHEVPLQHPLDFGGQFLSVLSGQIKRTTRKWICIRAAADGDEGDGAGKIALNGLLREAGPIAADSVEISAQRGAVTGVGRHHRAHLAVATGRAENGQRLVRRPAGRAAIPRERDLPFVPREPRRFPVGERRQSHLLQLVSQLFAVAFNGRLLIGGDWHRENVGGEAHCAGAAVRVRGTNRQALAWQAGLGLQTCRHFVNDER